MLMKERNLKIPVEQLQRMFTYNMATGVLVRKRKARGQQLDKTNRRKTKTVWVNGERI